MLKLGFESKSVCFRASACFFHYIKMCPKLRNGDNGEVGREEGQRRGDAGQCDSGDKIWEGWKEKGFGS